MLPQKKNPDAAELARAKAPRLIADLSGLLGVLSGLPLAYNKDLQEDKDYLFDAVDTLDLLLPAMAGMIADRAPSAPTGWPPRRRAASWPRPTSPTTWSGSGWPFRRAHEAVGRLVRACLEAGRRPGGRRRARVRRGRPRGRRAAGADRRGLGRDQGRRRAAPRARRSLDAARRRPRAVAGVVSAGRGRRRPAVAGARLGRGLLRPRRRARSRPTWSGACSWWTGSAA